MIMAYLLSRRSLLWIRKRRSLYRHGRLDIGDGQGPHVWVQVGTGSPALGQLLVIRDDHKLPGEGREDGLAAGRVGEPVRTLGQLDLLFHVLGRSLHGSGRRGKGARCGWGVAEEGKMTN